MVRQSNGISVRRGTGGPRGGGFNERGFGGRGRGFGFGGRARGGRMAMFSGRGGIQKPPPLMSRPMPPPMDMRHGLHRPGSGGPPPPRPIMHMIDEFGRMGPPRMPPPGFSSRGMMNFRMGPRGRGLRPPLRGMLPGPRLRGRGGLLPPPPMSMSGPPRPPGLFRPRPPMPPPGMHMNPMHMRGRPMPERGMPGRIFRGSQRGRGMSVTHANLNSRRGGKTPRGRGAKAKSVNSPSGELNKPWVTEAMKNEILKKHKLHQKAKKARTKEDWEIFKEHRNKVTTMLREAKLEYIGAHPDEDVEKILAEATCQVSDKDDTNEAPADSESNDTDPKVVEGAEPMEEGGVANEALPPPDPEVEMNQEPVTQTDTEPEPEPKPEPTVAQ